MKGKKSTQLIRNTFEDFLIDVNTRAAIAFGIAMIALLLAYIAFFK